MSRRGEDKPGGEKRHTSITNTEVDGRRKMEGGGGGARGVVSTVTTLSFTPFVKLTSFCVLISVFQQPSCDYYFLLRASHE